MAINPETQYSGKIAPSSPDYPYGEARNITTPGDGTGTPLDQAWLNDLYGMQQAFLTAAGITPSGSPDTAQTSQYLEAVKKIAAPLGENLIVDGGFLVWDEGTSQTSSGYGSDTMWQNINDGSTKTHTRETFALGQTDVPDNPRYFSRTVVSSVAGAGNSVRKFQLIENVAVTAGKKVTLSFYAKADANKNIATEFVQVFGSGGSPSSLVDQIGVTTFNLTTSWQKFSVTVDTPSITGKTLGTDNNDYLLFRFWFDAGSNFDSLTNSLGQQLGTFDIANVKLELGDTVTDFGPVDEAATRQRVSRYFERLKGKSSDQYAVAQAYGESTTLVTGTLKYELKRSIPAVSGSTGAGDFSVRNATGNIISASISAIFDAGESSAAIRVNRDSGTHLVADPFIMQLSNTGNGYIDIDARL